MTPTPEDIALAERIARSLDEESIYKEARKAMLTDATGSDIDYHLIRIAGERAALTAAMEVREKAAELANLRALDAWNEAERQGQNAVCASGRNYGARDICSAIRNGEHLR